MRKGRRAGGELGAGEAGGADSERQAGPVPSQSGQRQAKKALRDLWGRLAALGLQTQGEDMPSALLGTSTGVGSLGRLDRVADKFQLPTNSTPRGEEGR